MNINKIFNSFFLLYLIVAIQLAFGLNIITKTKWNGVESTVELTKLQMPVHRVIVMHSAGADCINEAACSQQVRNIQHFQMSTLKFDDIAYNFLVGNDGNIYEGRGWDYLGAYAKNYNTDSIGICFIGTYEIDLPSQQALDAAKELLEEGVRSKKIVDDYKLLGARQVVATNSPGSALYDVIKQWPHWSRRVKI